MMAEFPDPQLQQAGSESQGASLETPAFVAIKNNAEGSSLQKTTSIVRGIHQKCTLLSIFAIPAQWDLIIPMNDALGFLLFLSKWEL